MASERKIAANRANARASSGPKTARGKARASQNAQRHGLSLPVVADPALLKEVKELAREIAGDASDPEIMQEARAVAEAQIDLMRIRRARQNCLAQSRCVGDFDTSAGTGASTAWQTYSPERHATSAPISSKVLDQLLKIDRYERRAMSKRKFAIRRFDRARWEETQKKAGGTMMDTTG